MMATVSETNVQMEMVSATHKCMMVMVSATHKCMKEMVLRKKNAWRKNTYFVYSCDRLTLFKKLNKLNYTYKNLLYRRILFLKIKNNLFLNNISNIYSFYPNVRPHLVEKMHDGWKWTSHGLSSRKNAWWQQSQGPMCRWKWSHQLINASWKWSPGQLDS